MVNLNTKSGENNCSFNSSGNCTNQKITRGINQQNCTFTQNGAQSICSEYAPGTYELNTKEKGMYRSGTYPHLKLYF